MPSFLKRGKISSHTQAFSQTDPSTGNRKGASRTEPVFLTCMGPRNRFQGTNSASLCSLAGRYDNPLPPRFLAPIASLKTPAQVFFSSYFHFYWISVLGQIQNDVFCNGCITYQCSNNLTNVPYDFLFFTTTR